MKVSTLQLAGAPSKFDVLNDSTLAVFCDDKTSKVSVEKTPNADVTETSKFVVDEKRSFPGRLRQISKFDETCFVSVDDAGKIRLVPNCQVLNYQVSNS